MACAQAAGRRRAWDIAPQPDTSSLLSTVTRAVADVAYAQRPRRMSKFFKDSLWVTGGSAISMLANFAGQPVLNYGLGPSGRGALILIQTVISFAYEIPRLGTNRASNYLSAKGVPLGAVVATDVAMSIAPILASVIALIALYAAGSHEHGNALSAGVILAASAGVIFRAVGTTFTSPLAGKQHFSQLSKYMVLSAIVLLTARLAFVPTLGVSGALWAEALSLGTTTAAAYLFLRRHYHEPYRPSLDIAKKLFIFGLRSGVAIIATLITARASVMILYGVVGRDAAGLYAAAAAMAVPLATLPSIFAGQLMPRSATMTDETAVEQVGLVFRVSLVMTGLASVLLILCAPVLIGLFAGKEFLQIVPAFQLLLVAIPIRGVGSIIFGHLTGSGWPGKESVATVAAGSVIVLLSFLLIPPLGLAGAAIADIGGAVVLAVLAMYFFCRARHASLLHVMVIRQQDFAAVRKALISLARKTTPIK